MKRFEKQIVVVTGASSGIGEACALRFAEEGAYVACLDISETANEETAVSCRKFGVEAMALRCDVAEKVDVVGAITAVMDTWGRIDVLVTAAGITASTPLPEVKLENWNRLMSINLTGVFLCNQAVASIMIAQQSGSIINLSSMAGKTSWPATAEYSASKSGIIGLTRSVAVELAPYGVTANTVCPGHVLTPMLRGIAEKAGPREGMTGGEWLAMRAQDCPQKRMAEPWEIAGIIAFLASKDARYINGQAIEADGGMVMS
ncbi:MAG: SDR family NAD(P)-dependent oxidoreductase [Chloroflexi bacterium]|nr:MAG: SDR family NAD(P)-dependent oxidoreductase [Chloroflexota bacterium]